MASQFHNLMRFFTVLKNHGIENAVVSPGSRNAPLIKCLYDLNYQLISSVDERSAGFIALGMAKATGKPTILCSTSGTATLNFYPAITEAYYSRIPMLAITADRTFEQIDQWEGQSIRQNRVFQNHIRFQCQLDPQSLRTNPDTLGSEIIDVFNQIIPGPVHINVPLSEPLYDFESYKIRIESNAEISVKRSPLVVSSDSIQHCLGVDWSDKNVLFFHGMDDGEQISFDANGQVVLSDATSSVNGNIKLWDSILHVGLKGGKSLSNLQPDILVTCGTTTISKGLKLFLRQFPPSKHFHISYSNEVGKMFGTDPILIHPNALKRAKNIKNSTTSAYLNKWLRENSSFEKQMANLPWMTFSAFSAVRAILKNLPKKITIHAANSMAVRYLSFLAHPIIGNRGTSGIDGCTSTAVGYALRSPGNHLLITGDLAFFYDSNGLWLKSIPSNLKIVVLNNGGGGIFKMIDGPESMHDAIEYQVTNHQRSVKSLAEHFALPYLCIGDSKDLEQLLTEWLAKDLPAILEIKTTQTEDQYFYSLFNNLRL